VNERILIVDDDPAVHEVARAYLEREGYVVESALTARDGLALVGFGKIDAMVVDLVLPDLPGDSLLEEVRRRSSVPVLMLSGAAGTDERVHALTVGADDYLTKPFSPASWSPASTRSCAAAVATSRGRLACRSGAAPS
jgi:two-component system, OmpR family, response regulator ResD